MIVVPINVSAVSSGMAYWWFTHQVRLYSVTGSMLTQNDTSLNQKSSCSINYRYKNPHYYQYERGIKPILILCELYDMSNVQALTKYPFFRLISNTEQAELALSVLTVHGSSKEKMLLKPEALRIQQDFMRSDGEGCIITAINALLAAYLETYGEFSDQLTIFLSKSLVQKTLSKAS